MNDPARSPGSPEGVDSDDGGDGARRFRGFDALLPDILKRTLSSGLDSLASNEDSIRRLVREFKLPKEALTFLIAQSEKTRQEVVRILAKELRTYLERRDLAQDLKKLLDGAAIEVHTEIRFRATKGAGGQAATVEPEVSVRASRRGRPVKRKTSASTAGR